MFQLPPERRYRRSECVTFRKTREAFGAFSNMADGFALYVNGQSIRYAEALYQACRYPDAPDIQQAILAQKSPMAAKFVARKHVARTRADWEQIKVEVMRWVVAVKCCQHRDRLLPLLMTTGERSIVEESRRDRFWGATPSSDGETLFGHNTLGLLLMEIRDYLPSAVAADDQLVPAFSNARLSDRPITTCPRQALMQSPNVPPVQLALKF